MLLPNTSTRQLAGVVGLLLERASHTAAIDRCETSIRHRTATRPERGSHPSKSGLVLAHRLALEEALLTIGRADSTGTATGGDARHTRSGGVLVGAPQGHVRIAIDRRRHESRIAYVAAVAARGTPSGQVVREPDVEVEMVTVEVVPKGGQSRH